jgi:hypothetical protein
MIKQRNIKCFHLVGGSENPINHQGALELVSLIFTSPQKYKSFLVSTLELPVDIFEIETYNKRK